MGSQLGQRDQTDVGAPKKVLATAAPLTISILCPVASITRAASALAAPGIKCPAPGVRAWRNCWFNKALATLRGMVNS